MFELTAFQTPAWWQHHDIHLSVAHAVCDHQSATAKISLAAGEHWCMLAGQLHHLGFFCDFFILKLAW